MEHGLWPTQNTAVSMRKRSLNPCLNGTWSLTTKLAIRLWKKSLVLILVWMEHGLWLVKNLGINTLPIGLNPCLNGTWSLTFGQKMMIKSLSGLSLNPCLNGTWSLSFWCTHQPFVESLVLILVWMEHGLWPLWLWYGGIYCWKCLNPCLNGTWSLTWLPYATGVGGDES